MKMFKKTMAILSAVVMSVSAFGIDYVEKVNAAESHGMGDLSVSESEEQAHFSQFDSSDCSIDLNNITSVPTSCDLSTNEDSVYFPPIGDQGNINSCTAWATTYYQFTYAANKLNEIETTSSNAYSPAWTYNYTNCGINKGTTYTEAYNILKNQGAVTLADMPHNSSNYSYAWPNDTSMMMKALNTRLSYDGVVTIPGTGTPITSKTDTDLREAKFLLSTGHILLIRTQIGSWSYKGRYGNTNEKVAYRAARDAYYENSGHAMALVGYNDNVCCDVNGNGSIEPSERGAFKIANSWGSGSGNNGYIWVLYDALNKVSANTTNNWENKETGTRISIFDREIRGVNEFHFIEVKNYDVNLAGLLTVKTNYRNKLRVSLFRNDTNTNAYTGSNSITFFDLEIYDYYPEYLDNSAPFNGSMLFDYGSFDDPVSICTNGYYFGVDINNIKSNTTGSLTNVSFKIIDDKFNTVKQITGLSSTVGNGSNTKSNAKIACIKGDIDYDGSVTTTDSTLLLNFLTNAINLSNLQHYLADYDNNGIVNVADLSELNSYLISGASANELRQISEINQKVKMYMIKNDYSESDIALTNELSQQINECMEELSYEKK